MFTDGLRHGANLVGVPTGLLASAAFNDYPLPLHIAGVFDTHRELFDAVAAATAPTEAAEIFEQYMSTTFALRDKDTPTSLAAAPRRYRASYLQLLRGWGFDSNSREGAVLKAWVESRFGLLPRFHREPLARIASSAWIGYVEDKLSSRFHNNSIFLQLDLLYEFCQMMLARWHHPGRHVALYRGVNDYVEHCVVHDENKGDIIVRMNNLVSFTQHRSIACQFGDHLLAVRVPKVKIMFFSDLLLRHPLKGEAEYLVIGGDYRVSASYY